MSLPDGQLEWLETNRLGSFCFACVDRKLRRKYHALLTVRDPGRGDSWNLLAETRETVLVGAESALLADPLHANAGHEGHAASTLTDFSQAPYATHDYRVLGLQIERRVRLAERDQIELRYRVRNVRGPLRLLLEPLLRCRPLHELTHENPFLDGTCVKLGEEVRMLPYAGMPAIAMRVYGARASFEEQGAWLQVARYEWEAQRGYPAQESLFSPGRFSLELSEDAELTFVVGLHRVESPQKALEQQREPSLEAFDSPLSNRLARAADQFFANHGAAQTAVVAGYPWLAPRTRDALIALPGLYVAGSSWQRIEAVLATLAEQRVHGLLADPPAFPGAPRRQSGPEASLLFARTLQWFAERVGKEAVAPFMPVVCELLESLAEGADPRVHFDRGVSLYTEPGSAPLTWMDALSRGRPVTPRAGYAIELDALLYNALHFACAWADEKRPGFARIFRNRLRNAEGTFVARYWDDARGYLADAHDGDQADARLRPNQLWALALPHRPVSSAIAQSSLRAVTRQLWTPVGLRTLCAHDPDYRGSYRGTEDERERACHQGSVWPSLLGLYADATFGTLGRAGLAEHVAPIAARLAQHLELEGCIGQVSQLFDGDAPHGANGAPAHAISVAELCRVQHMLSEAREDDLNPRASSAKRSPQSNQHSRETVSK